MASVQWVGSTRIRMIESEEWSRVGAPGPTVTWDVSNGWSIPESNFSLDQLYILADTYGFLTGQPDGPRPFPPPPLDSDQERFESLYYRKTLELYEQFPTTAEAAAQAARVAIDGQVGPAVTADLETRDLDYTDNLDGTGTVTIGGVGVGTFEGNHIVWSGIPGKPTVIGAGADQAAARAAINAEVAGASKDMDDITDAGAPGKALVRAATEALARDAIGAAGGVTTHEVDWTPGDEDGGIGVDGEYAINNADGFLWGPKAVGAWPAPSFLGSGEISINAGLPGEVLPHEVGVFKDANRTLATGVAYLLRWRPMVSRSIVSVAFEVITAAGNDDDVDVGVYSISLDGLTLTRIVSTGATAGKLNSTGIKTLSLSGTFTPDTTYVAALSAKVTGTAPVVAGRGMSSGGLTTNLFGSTFPNALVGGKGLSHPLPTTISSPGLPGNTVVPIVVMREI